MPDLHTANAYARRDLLSEQAVPLRAQVGARIDPGTQRLISNRVAVAETVTQDWPRCGGDRIDGAEVWLGARFTDEQVVAWLEAGVYTAAAAVRLARAGVEPREVGGEYETNVTLGLAFTRGDVSVDDVLRLRRPALEVTRG